MQITRYCVETALSYIAQRWDRSGTIEKSIFPLKYNNIITLKDNESFLKCTW